MTGVNGVDGHGGVAYAHALHVFHVLRQGQTVGGHAEGDIGVFLADHLQRAEGFLGICQRVAGAGDAHNRKIGHVALYFHKVVKSLCGREHGGGDAGAAFVNAVVLAQAVVAAQVALGRDGQMQARRSGTGPTGKQGWDLVRSALTAGGAPAPGAAEGAVTGTRGSVAGAATSMPGRHQLP